MKIKKLIYYSLLVIQLLLSDLQLKAQVIGIDGVSINSDLSLAQQHSLLPDSQNLIKYNKLDGLLYSIHLDQNQSFDHAIVLQNSSEDSISISRVFCQDPLLVSSYPKGKIAPNARFLIRIRFPSDLSRSYNKPLTIFFNEGKKPFVMPIEASTQTFFNLASEGECAKRDIGRQLDDVLIPMNDSKNGLLDSLLKETISPVCMQNDFIGWNCFTPFCMPNNTVWTLESVLMENINSTFWNNTIDLLSLSQPQKAPITKRDTNTFYPEFAIAGQQAMLTSIVDCIQEYRIETVEGNYFPYFYASPYCELTQPLISNKLNVRFSITKDYQYILIHDHWDDPHSLETPPGKNHRSSHNVYWILKRA